MSEARRKAAPPRRHKRHWAVRVLGWLTALGCLGIILGTAAFFIIYQKTRIPDGNVAFEANTSTVTWANGTRPMGTFYDQNRTSVPLKAIPKRVQDAILAAEDRTFWTNPGISPQGMARAAFNIARGEQLQGGSTITQQYVKIMYLTQERTASRKFKELFIATKLSRQQDKSKTLEGYLNTIYFGEGAYGISAAGEAYFRKPDPNKLTVPEAAFLATVLNNPTLFDIDVKANHPRILQRYRYVLDGMRLSGTITEAEQTKYAKALPKLNKKPKSNKYKGTSGFLLDMVRRELLKRGYSEQEIESGGYKIVSTFDYDLQQKMVTAATERRPQKRDNLHVGMAAVKPGTGQLVAMYGGPDFLKNQINWATAKARPGSTFKPFAVAAAIDEEWNPWERNLQGDSPIEVQGQEFNNEFSHDYGVVDLVDATKDSVNTAFYDLVDKQMENGPSKLVDAAEKAGIPKTTVLEKGRENPATVLGPDPYASPVDMANAYATFAAEGKQVELHTIKSITDRKGKVVWEDKKLPVKQAFEPRTAQWVNFILSKVVEDGTGDGAKKLDQPAAGKTGTAGGVGFEHRKADAACGGCKAGTDTLTSWWTGYTTTMSTAVIYRAGTIGESDLDPYSKDPAFFGGNWPLKTWMAFMEPALDGVSETEFTEPPEDELEDSPKPPPPTDTPKSPPPATNTPTPTNTPPPTTNSPPPNTNTPKPPETPPTKTPGRPTITFPTGDPDPEDPPPGEGGGGGGQ
ncbi:penicillin-binding protein [Kribbella sandramycini]|uniref:Membrane peptidoglycan carboxypeptidase n=1 Tax=Kribbella sandramycini TaxID=60450 RepID=A0A7Y4KZY3_9ACTN|nr:membrane peptidoglycan carboxypeptidase [Kribbella sandramycini]NOL41760.1 penicillin-binding protein [Kribbella sandramycini]